MGVFFVVSLANHLSAPETRSMGELHSFLIQKTGGVWERAMAWGFLSCEIR